MNKIITDILDVISREDLEEYFLNLYSTPGYIADAKGLVKLIKNVCSEEEILKQLDIDIIKDFIKQGDKDV